MQGACGSKRKAAMATWGAGLVTWELRKAVMAIQGTGLASRELGTLREQERNSDHAHGDSNVWRVAVASFDHSICVSLSSPASLGVSLQRFQALRGTARCYRPAHEAAAPMHPTRPHHEILKNHKNTGKAHAQVLGEKKSHSESVHMRCPELSRQAGFPCSKALRMAHACCS